LFDGAVGVWLSGEPGARKHRAKCKGVKRREAWRQPERAQRAACAGSRRRKGALCGFDV
jgi:hypothetical protein